MTLLTCNLVLLKNACAKFGQWHATDMLGHVWIELCQNILHYPLKRYLICIHTHADAKYQHPLLYETHSLSEEQLRLACCCLCECSKQLEGPRLCAVWKVEEQPAVDEGSSNSYTAGSQNLGTGPLCPRFRDAASRQHGLWASGMGHTDF